MEMSPIEGAVARVVEAGGTVGLSIVPRRFPDGTRTAADAAAAVGVHQGRIVKSLVFDVDGEAVVALVGGTDRLDEQRLAAAAGGSEVSRPDAERVRAVTGFAIGGVPPIGHATGLRVFMDEALLEHSTVWAAAGTGHDVFEVDPRALADATRSEVGEIRKPPEG